MIKYFFYSCLILTAPKAWSFSDKVRFAPETNGVQRGPPTVLFQVKENPLNLEIGTLEIPLGAVEARFAREEGFGLLRFRWPAELIQPDFLAALEDGTQSAFFADAFTAGSYELDNDMKLKKVQGSTDQLLELKAPLAFFERRPQLCLSQSLPQAIKTLCFDSAERKRPFTLALNGVVQPLRGSLSLEKERLEVSLIRGAISFFVESPVPEVHLFEVTELNPTTLRVRTHGAALSGEVRTHNQRTPFFQHTIGDLKVYYETEVLKEAPFIRAASNIGIQFQFPLQAKNFPQEQVRPEPLGRIYKSSYADTLDLEFKPAEGTEMSSTQANVQENRIWTVATPEKNQINVATLKVKNKEGVENTLDLDFYRGSRSYLSARVGFSVADSGWAVIGDFLGTHWLNEPFGSSDYFSRQRWGVTAGQISSLVSEDDDKFSVRNFDVLYRFTPGVAGWTETLGLGVGTLDFQYQDLDPIRFMGAGVFWSRSLPNWFNYLFGFLPFFRKPKWADVHVMFYPNSMTEGVSGTSLQIRATGRIELSPTTYFEGGWGIGNTSYTDEVLQKKVDLLAGRGFLGFGMRF